MFELDWFVARSLGERTRSRFGVKLVVTVVDGFSPLASFGVGSIDTWVC